MIFITKISLMVISQNLTLWSNNKIDALIAARRQPGVGANLSIAAVGHICSVHGGRHASFQFASYRWAICTRQLCARRQQITAVRAGRIELLLGPHQMREMRMTNATDDLVACDLSVCHAPAPSSCLAVRFSLYHNK